MFGAKSHLLGLESHSYLEFGHALVKEEETNLDIQFIYSAALIIYHYMFGSLEPIIFGDSLTMCSVHVKP